MSDKAGRFLEGIILGGILGYLFGTLSAPKSGSELRKQLVNSSEDLYKQASESLSEFKEKTNQALTDFQTKGENILKKASDSLPLKKPNNSSHAKAMAEDADSLSF